MLEYPNLSSVEILQVYCHHVCHGHYSSQSNRIKADLVATMWRSIVGTYLLEGHYDYRNLHGSHVKDLNKRLTRML